MSASQGPSRSTEQRRAASALRAVRRVGDGEPRVAAEYRSYVAALPATVRGNGLGQAMATLLAQARGCTDTGHALLYQHLSDWLCGGDPYSPYPSGDLLEHLIEHDQRRYVLAQSEALAYLEWLKRLATAFLTKADAPDGTE